MSKSPGMAHIKNRVYTLLNVENAENSRLNRLINGIIMLLIVLSVVEVVAGSFRNLPGWMFPVFRNFEFFVVIIFTGEYLLRIWIADMRHPEMKPWRARVRFITSFMGLVDLIAILPFYLPFFFTIDLRYVRILRVMRLLRIFKLNRHSKALRIVGEVIQEKRAELSVTLVVAFLLLLLSSAVMYNLEFDVQPDKFPNILATFWWAVATLTTVGYGDVYPITDGGKIVAGIMALLGVGLVALPAGILSGAFMDKLGKNRDSDSDPTVHYRFCPHCGQPLHGPEHTESD